MARTAHQQDRIIPRDINQPITTEMMVQLRAAWPNAARLNVAWRLAKDVDTLEALLAGQPVDPERIHQGELERAFEPRLVQLVRPIDVLEVQAA
jgi:hypothetical protein